MSSPLKQNTTTIQELLNTINELPEAGGSDPVLQDKTVTPTTSRQSITADSGYDGLDTVTVNAMPTATQATPAITVNSSGLITATATQTAGYVAAGTKSGTKQLTTQAAKTIIPSTSSQTAVASGRYTTGAVTVAGDVNLKAENIAEGVSIFGVTGTHSGGSGGSGGGSVETCTVTVINQRTSFRSMTYNSEEGNVYTTNVPETNKSATITVLKNGLLVIMATNFLPNVTISGDITLLGNGTTNSYIKGFVFDIKGDGTITIRDDD